MITNASQMSCGNCGNKTFELYTTRSENSIIVECMKCKSTSIIRPTEPQIQIGWGENSDGIICVFPKDSK